jgi:preprotein translocase SecE subunit
MSISKLLNFFKDTFSEFSNVTWPARAEVYVFSLIVFLMLTTLGIFFVAIDTFVAYLIGMALC